MPSATCGKCEAPGLEWARSPLGVHYLRDSATGAEHLRTCSGVDGAQRAESPQVIALAPLPPVGAPPAPVDDDMEALNAELEYADAMHAATVNESRAACDWPDLRRQILAYGGIGPTPDFPRDWIPADLYRVNGKPPDLVAVEAVAGAPWGDTGDDSAMLDYLHRSWAQWQAAQEQRRPRARKAPTSSPAAALAQPAPRAHLDERAIVLDVARLVADVADCVASAPDDSQRRRFAHLARAAAELAQLLTEDRADV